MLIQSVKSCYVEGKRFCESLALDYLRIHKTDIELPEYLIHTDQEWPKKMGE